MRTYLGAKYHSDDRNRGTIESISAVLTICGFQTYCVRRDLEVWGAVALSPQELMTKTFEAIRTCELTVIDLTEKGVGLGIEAGYAYAHAIPIITIAQEGSDVSGTLRGISRAVYLYKKPADLQVPFSRLFGNGQSPA